MIAPRLRHRLGRHDTRAIHDRLVRAHAASAASFADIGCMWRIDGANAFAAEEAGAKAVTAVDVMGPTPAFLERAASSRVRFVQGDINDPATIGPHEVVWCSGVLYHVPDPQLTVQRLSEVTVRRLLLATEVLPAGGRRAVYLPTRRDHPGAPEAAPQQPDGYAPWYWLPSPGAVRAMLEIAGLSIRNEIAIGPYHRIFVVDR